MSARRSDPESSATKAELLASNDRLRILLTSQNDTIAGLREHLATAKAERESAVRAFVVQLQGETGVAFEEGERRGFERACEAMANRVSPLSGLDGEIIVKVRNIIYELRDSKVEPR